MTTIRIPAAPGDKWLLPGDIHGGIQDDALLEVMLDAAHNEGARGLCLNGDTQNCASVSNHPIEPKVLLRAPTLQDEAEMMRWFYDRSREQFEHLIIRPGNHEYWVERNADESLGMHGTVKWHTPFDHVLEGFQILEDGDHLTIGRVNVHHGDDLLRIGGVDAARKILAMCPNQITVANHYHQMLRCVTPTLRNGKPVQHGAFTNGHMSYPELHRYARTDRHRWTLGFLMLEFFELDRGKPGVTVHEGRFFEDSRGRRVLNFLGKTYRAGKANP